VFGLRAGRAMSNNNAAAGELGTIERPAPLIPEMSEPELRALTWEYCGIARDRDGLECAIRKLSQTGWRAGQPTLAGMELRNMHQVASLIADRALWREESRGAHYRTDFPDKCDEFLKPSLLTGALTKSALSDGEVDRAAENR
jgi:fumarate reductase (CoM/CoB) subunit A